MLKRQLLLAAGALTGGLLLGLSVGAHAKRILPATTEPGLLAAAEPVPATAGFLDIGQLVVPLVAGGRTQAFLLAEITLQLRDDEAVREAKRQLPVLRDVALRTLLASAGELPLLSDRIDPALLAEAVRRGLAQQLPSAGLQQVLFDRLLLQDNLRT